MIRQGEEPPIPGRRTWTILTGEYPPQRGGVADHTRVLARALVAAGDRVCVWAPDHGESSALDHGIDLRRCRGHFGPAALVSLHRALRTRGPSERLLIQYVPHAFGWRAMNLLFCLWLLVERRAEIHVLFHEVAYPLEAGQRLRHRVLALVNRIMARIIAAAADRIYVTIPAWAVTLREIGLDASIGIEWLPVASNLPTRLNAESVRALRAQMTPTPGRRLVGHFGTYGSGTATLLEPVVTEMLAQDPNVTFLLAGRRAGTMRDRLLKGRCYWAERIIVAEDLSPDDIAHRLAACDLMMQPYPDGVSCRRGTVMAGLALGVPVVTTEGPLTDTIWRDANAVSLAPSGDVLALVERAQALLNDSNGRRALGNRGRVFYDAHFAVEHAVGTLRR